MATNRTRRKRNRKDVAALDSTIMEYFFTGTIPERETPAWDLHISRHFDSGQAIREAWTAHRETLMAEWIGKHPGSRPWGWWRYEAPAEPVENSKVIPPGQWSDTHRQRIGGTGTPSHEVLAIAPHFDRGIPESWVDKRLEDYYNGRAKDIHGKPIGTEYKEGHFKGVAIDKNDPRPPRQY